MLDPCARDVVVSDTPIVLISQEHNIFTTNNIFHNYLAHHVLTAYSLGAPLSLLEKIYKVGARAVTWIYDSHRV
jgi:hypothetical protein